MTAVSVAGPMVLALVSVCSAALAGEEEVRRPNFVVVFADDQGYNDLGCFGSKKIKTPNIDRLAAEGTRFTSFYAQAVCGPSRAALMTGCYPIRVAEPGNIKHQHTILHPGETTLAETLKSAGYATACVGKWHLGIQRDGRWDPETMPNGQGFDYFYGTPLYNGFTVRVNDTEFRSPLYRNDQVVVERIESWDAVTQDYTEEAIRFIRENRDGPFFLYLAHNMPHVPLGASEAFRGKSEYGPYGDAIEEIDASTGQIVAALRELGLDRNTLLIYTSDNGPWIETTRGNAPDGKPFIPPEHSGCADPLRGYKMLTWEGGLRVPCVMWWPGRVPAAATCDEVAATIDLLPTLAKLAGVEPVDDRVLDGKDIWPLVSGEPDAGSPHEAFFYFSFTHLQAVRSGPWKLVLSRPEHPKWVGWSGRFWGSGVDAVELYDLDADPGETQNVAEGHADVVKRLMKLVEAARAELGDYDRIGEGARFFDDGARRPESRRWIEGRAAASPRPMDGGGPYPHDFTYTPAIAHEPGIARRDPSDVVRVDDQYYVWYTKVLESQQGYPSGYPGSIWYATSPDGLKWTEQGPSIEPGADDAWDGHGVFTPNILVTGGKCYLYYTGVPEPFDVPWTAGVTPTAIGVAVADCPEGPWRQFDANPILRPSDAAEDFDSFRVDDAALIAGEGKTWLYYKGRSAVHGQAGPGKTRMGVAVGDCPTGPFVRQEANPLHPGHEVMVWPQGKGVASLASAAGPRRVYFAPDGLNFQPRNMIVNRPQAPGAFRADRSEQDAPGEGVRWGISQANRDGDVYLLRFDCRWTLPAAVQGNRASVEYDHPAPLGDLRFDFETGDLQGWKVVEGRFEALVNDRSHFHHTLGAARYNKQGKHFLTTLERAGGGRGNDQQTGIVESPEFTLRGDRASFLVGGGRHANTYVALVDAQSGEELLTARGANTEIMQRIDWDVASLKGRRVRLRLVDQNMGGWGHVTFDDFSCQAALDGPAAVPDQ